jgi:hypothetical protein
VSGDWLELLYRGAAAASRVQRSAYELCLFTALRERLRCKEIWVEGADRWRNSDADLPADFETRRLEHYRALARPRDPAEFIEPLQAQMREELLALQQALPSCDWLRITDKRGGQITLSPLEEAPEPRNLRRLKAEVGRRWGLVPLLDMLKEAALRVGLLEHFAPAGTREIMDRSELAEKLILCLFGYGTNIGLRSIAGGEHGHTEDELRYVRRRYLSAAGARSFAAAIANATFTARQTAIWGEGSSAVASDSTHFGAFDQNLFTQYHVRYGGRGVLIYWTISSSNTPPLSVLARPPPRRSCAGSPAQPPTRPIRRCWRSAAPKRPSSCAATCVTVTCSGKSTPGSTSPRAGTAPTPKSSTARPATSPPTAATSRK